MFHPNKASGKLLTIGTCLQCCAIAAGQALAGTNLTLRVSIPPLAKGSSPVKLDERSSSSFPPHRMLDVSFRRTAKGGARFDNWVLKQWVGENIAIVNSPVALLKTVRHKYFKPRTQRMTWDLRFQKEILRRLCNRLDDLGLPETGELIRMINNEIERILVEYSHLVVDEKTRPHLRLTACVLASYQALASGLLDPKQALELAEAVFISIGRTTLKLYTQAMLTFSKDPFIAITNAGKKRALEQYGRAWEFKFEETENSFTMTSTKCFYHDFFTAAGAQQLTRVFCSWDENWIKPIDPTKHGILFERPTTMGYGGNECPFIFTRIEASPG